MNLSRFEGIDSLAEQIIFNVKDCCKVVFSGAAITSKRCHSDEDLLRGLGILCLKKTIITKWLKLEVNWVKLNTDGCSKSNPGLSGGGSLLRGHKKKIIWAQTDFFDVQTNTVAECRALLQGVRRCVAEGWPRVVIEADSLVMVNILTKKSRSAVVYCL